MRSGLDYEFRTTCVRPLVTSATVERIARLIRGSRLYVLQPFRAGDILRPEFFEGDPGFSEAEMAELARRADLGRVLPRAVRETGFASGRAPPPEPKNLLSSSGQIVVSAQRCKAWTGAGFVTPRPSIPPATPPEDTRRKVIWTAAPNS